ncbi:MAG: CoA-acylating methylmalonate-semialdehyde dehydrogenase [Myxococcales bacterium]|nr:CoA-acylating methylmalonate-semialdehyde dehydrogenase [Myxococcales bacterium]
MTLVNLPGAPIVAKNLIGGEWRDGATGERIEVRSPYTNQVIGSVPSSTMADVEAAAAAAKDAAAKWRQVPIKERTQLLFRYREHLLRDLEPVSHSAAAEAGKTVAEARAGVLKGIEIVEYALSLQNMDVGGTLEVSRGVTCETKREPLGVVAGITPFNFPAMVPMWQFPIAVTLGNAFILKPSEKVPLTSNLLGELMIEAGFPPGVFSIVHGGRPAVEALCDHPDIAALGFVGSTTVARAVYQRVTAHDRRALCLGGAKNHLIVVPDAERDVTIDGVVGSFVGCAGQRCMAASLMIAVGDSDALIDAIVEKARSVRLGPDMGAIIDRAALERLEGDIQKAVDQGAKLRLDGRKPKAPAGYEEGNWLAPTILDHASMEMECTTKELFGPVLTIVRVKTLDEALALQDSTPYGNAASVFTSRGDVARYVAERVRTGMVGVNIGVPVPREPFSFGGNKASRFGQGDMTGAGAIELWTWLKKITTKWSLQPDANWMS